MTALGSPNEIIAFWRAAGYSRWFKADPLFDRLVRMRLLAAHEAAAHGLLESWMEEPEGALALMILLDQAPRNLFRGTPRAFATDDLALALAEIALRRGFHRRIPRLMRRFFYLPFMHAEDLAAQHRCLALFEAEKDADGAKYAEIHLDIIRRFGRFPHRNPILGRTMLPEEAAFLAAGGFAG